MTSQSRLDIRKIRIIFKREFRDQLRDRRTLFMVMAFPILLYPALGIGMLQMAVIFSEKPRTVVVLGADSLPEPELIAGSAFAVRWFANPKDASRLKVESTGQHNTNPSVANRLKIARHVQDLYQQRTRLLNDSSTTTGQSSGEIPKSLQQINDSINSSLRDAEIAVLVVIPDGFANSLEEVNRQIVSRERTAEDPSEYPRPVILVSGDEKSLIASRRVQEVFDVWENELLRLRLEVAGLPRSLPSPVNASVVRVTANGQDSALVWSKLFPMILVVMTVTGAFYPAVDLAAGEKERGTMETLLISPAKRIELVLAKFLTILVFSLATGILNLISLGLTATYMVQLSSEVVPNAQAAVANPINPGLLWILVMIFPLAALFSALSLALATFARSTREGQYYLSPLMVVVLMLVALAASPGAEIQPFHSVLPVIGPVLLLKQLMIDPAAPEFLAYLPVVLGASFTYAGLALWWAVSQFHSETVLFREAERFDIRLWLRRLRTHKPSRPGPGLALACLAFGLLGQVLMMPPLGAWLTSLAPDDRPRAAIWMLILQQLLLFLGPACLAATALLTDAKGTLRLRRTGLTSIAYGVALAFALHPLVEELMNHLQWFFPPGLPDGSLEFLRSMLGVSQPAWLVLLAVAVTPAVCEEFLFRGFVLSALDRPGHRRLAVVLSAFAFGAVHMIPQQVFYATLLGLVLGLMALRTGSIWPGLAFHLTFNGISVLKERWSVPDRLPAWSEWLISVDADGFHFDWPLLVGTAAVAAILVKRVNRLPESGSVQ